MQLLVVLAVSAAALLGVAADEEYSPPTYQPHYGRFQPVGGPAPPNSVQKATEEFNRLYHEAAALAAAAPDDHQTYYQPRQYYQASPKPYYSGPGPAKQQTGGVAPTYAVQKATEEFHRLYKEAAARAAAAPDDPQTYYQPQQYYPTTSKPYYGGPRPAKRPVGGPAPLDAVQKATAEFNKLYHEAAARAAAAPDDYQVYSSQPQRPGYDYDDDHYSR